MNEEEKVLVIGTGIKPESGVAISYKAVKFINQEAPLYYQNYQYES